MNPITYQKELIVALTVGLVVALVSATISTSFSSQTVSLAYAQERMESEAESCGLNVDYLKPEKVVSTYLMPMTEGFLSLDNNELKSFEIGTIQITDEQIILNNFSAVVEVFETFFTYDDEGFRTGHYMVSTGFLTFKISSLIYNYTGDTISLHIQSSSFVMDSNSADMLNVFEVSLSDLYIKGECTKSNIESRILN